MSILALLFLATLFLAYSNGANDNFKGVATLFGSGTTDYKRAIAWATITTLAGSLCSIFLPKPWSRIFRAGDRGRRGCTEKHGKPRHK